MPRKYQRKLSVKPRALWTESQLSLAVEKVKSGEISKHEAERQYNVPIRTITRRIKSGNVIKGPLGPEGVLGKKNEERLVSHIKRLGAAGFAPDQNNVRKLAYSFAEMLQIKHKFSKEKKKAGHHWFLSFMERNSDLSIRKSEGLSLARAKGMNRADVTEFFKLLENELIENDLISRPSNIFNMDEAGIQMINKPGKVIAAKGSKDVHVLTSRERGENITIIACCNAEGSFLPPVLIFKGINKKPEFSDGMPSGSQVYMNKKSSFINSELFCKWLKEHFIPRKPEGKTLLILDGHTSHSSDFEMLHAAEQNDIILLCLPSHCTQAIQPLDKSVFGPLKTYWNQEAHTWMLNHPNRNLTRYQAGQIIGKAWSRAATPSNAISGFRGTGIFPMDMNAIPEHFFAISDSSINRAPSDSNASLNQEMSNLSAGSDLQLSPVPPPTISTSKDNDITPSKFLHEIRPLPKIPISFNKRKQSANVLTSPENLIKKRKMSNPPKLIKKGKALQNKCDLTSENKENFQLHKKIKTPSKLTMSSKLSNLECHRDADEWESDEEPLSNKIQKELDNEPNTTKVTKNKKYLCVECFEEYYTTTKKDDWIECITCRNWLHEKCTMYEDTCNICTREKLKKKNYGNT